MIYQFTTHTNCKVAVYFIRLSDRYGINPQNPQINPNHSYMMGLESDTSNCLHTKNPRDTQIMHTTCDIIKDFFEVAGLESFIYFHCDYEDGKEDLRHKLFNMWFDNNNNDGSLSKENVDIKMETEDGFISIHHMLIYRSDHPYPAIIIEEFFNTSSFVLDEKDPNNIVI